MSLIGTIAAGLFVLLGVIMLTPIFFTRAVRETYNGFKFWKFMGDLPVWTSYLLLLVFSLVFWFSIGYLLFR